MGRAQSYSFTARRCSPPSIGPHLEVSDPSSCGREAAGQHAVERQHQRSRHQRLGRDDHVPATRYQVQSQPVRTMWHKKPSNSRTTDLPPLPPTSGAGFSTCRTTAPFTTHAPPSREGVCLIRNCTATGRQHRHFVDKSRMVYRSADNRVASPGCGLFSTIEDTDLDSPTRTCASC